MIVVSGSLVLAETQESSPNHPVIGYHNIATFGTLTADTEDADFPAVNLTNPATYLKWKAADTTEQYLTVEPNYVDEVDYIGIARHNFGTIQAPITIEGQETDGGAWEVLVEEILLADDKPVIFRWEPQSLFAVRVKIGEGDAEAEAAVLYYGKLLVLQRRIYVGHAPIPLSRVRQITNARSESGQFLGRIVTGETAGGAISLNNVQPAWLRTNLSDPGKFFDTAATEPFFFAWRPGTYSREVAYCWLTNDPKPSNTRGNGFMGVDLQVGALVT